MQPFIHPPVSQLGRGQTAVLQQFLADAQQTEQLDAAELQALLGAVGELLPFPDLDATDPVGYNQQFRTLLADLAGLYASLDQVDAAQSQLHDLNRTELNRVEQALRGLRELVLQARRVHQDRLQYQDVFTETFGPETEQETDPAWYQPLLQETDGAQSLAAALPAWIDPEDGHLKLQAGGDYSRVVSTEGAPLATVTLEQLLGHSEERQHPLSQACDGRHDTFWREEILATAPIHADPLQVPWLPPTYRTGAACRIHFHWPSAVPFTELKLRPLTRFPTQILQAAWDNRERPLLNLITNPNFAAGSTAWATGGSAGFSFPQLGPGTGPCAQLVAGNGRVTLTSNTVSLSGTHSLFHLRASLYRPAAVRAQLLVTWEGTAGTQLRHDWEPVPGVSGEWYEHSRLLQPPSGAARVYLTLATEGSGTIRWTDLCLSPTAGKLQTVQSQELGASVLTLPLGAAAGTDLWVVLNQPHYELISLTLPDAERTQQELWDQLAGYPSIPTARRTPALPAGDQLLYREARRLGGRIRDLLEQLLRYARPAAGASTTTRYRYTLGAVELAVRYREYAAQGRWVSKPLKPRGEIREVILQTDPPLAGLNDRVRFWLAARADEGLDKLRPFTGRATFGAPSETQVRQADPHFTLAPVTRVTQYPGTDRNGAVSLAYPTWLDRDRLWTLHTALTSGTITTPLAFDPNRETYYLDIGAATPFGVDGYRPLRVTLRFPDGTQALPDTLGPLQFGELAYAGPEVLRTATTEEEELLEAFDEPEEELPLSQIKNLRERRRERRRRAQQRQQQPQSARRTRRRSRTRTEVTVLTRFGKLAAGPYGVALSLYWHKSDNDTTAGTLQTSGDVLINPARYEVEPDTGLITVRATPPQHNPDYDSFVAYYYYYRDEQASREALDARAAASLPVSGIDFGGPRQQGFPVTRNITDYVYGTTRSLREYRPDRLDPDYYPVFEYREERGQLRFGEVLGPGGDRAAEITVEHASLEIAPRLLVEFLERGTRALSSETPELHSFTLLMDGR